MATSTFNRILICLLAVILFISLISNLPTTDERYVPTASGITVPADDGNITVDDDGNVNVEDEDGNVTVDDDGNVIVEDEDGNVTVDDEGNVNVEDEDGNVSVDDDGNVTVVDEDGTVKVDDDGNVTVDDDSGTITVQSDDNGDTVVKMEGDGTISGKVQLNYTDGETGIKELNMEISVNTNGTVEVKGVPINERDNYRILPKPVKGRWNSDESDENLMDIGLVFEITSDDQDISGIHLKLDIRDRIPAGVDADRIKLFWLDKANDTWVKIEQSSYDPVTGVLTANIDHLTIFAPMAEETVQEKGSGESGDSSLFLIIGIIGVLLTVLFVIFIVVRKKRPEEVEEGVYGSEDDGKSDF